MTRQGLLRFLGASLSISLSLGLIACSSEDSENKARLLEAPQKSSSKTKKPATESSSRTTSTTPTPSAGCSKGSGGAQLGRSIEVNGDERSYDLVVPDSYDGGQTYPLVFAFHGGGGTSEDARHALDFSKVAGDDAIVVYPSARDGDWDLDTPADDNADVAFFDRLVETIEASHCVDASRVFATGYSNGAYFTNQLGCRRGDVLRGIAPHAGGGPYGDDDAYDDDGNLRCSGGPVAAMVFHGEADDVVWIDEGEASVSQWKWANGCGDGTTKAATKGCVAYEGCENPVVWCSVPDLGHDVWSQGVKASWAFFSQL